MSWPMCLAAVVIAAIVSAIVAIAPARAETAAVAAQRGQVRQLEVELYALTSRAQAAAVAEQAAQSRVDEVTGRLRDAKAQLWRAQRDFKVAQERLSARVVGIYRERRPSTIELLMGSKTLTGALDTYGLLKRIGRQDATVVGDIRGLRIRLTVLKRRLAAERVTAREAAREAATRRAALASAASARSAVLARAQRSLTILIAREEQRAAAARLAALQAARARLAARAKQPVAAVTTASGLASGPAAESPVAVRAPSGALAAIAQCESGGNPRALSPGGTYRGKYQFHPDTWRALGGRGSDPAAAPEAEQDRVAAVLYSRTGGTAWPVCGR